MCTEIKIFASHVSGHILYDNNIYHTSSVLTHHIADLLLYKATIERNRKVTLV